MKVEHKFLKSYKLIGKKVLIIGTFNPDILCNNAAFFYGRVKNYFWELLPYVFNDKSLKNESLESKINFLENNEIELTDLISLVEISESEICNYSDDKLKNVLTWNTNNIIDTLQNKKTKEVYFTRKSFDNNVRGIKDEIYKIKAFCESNQIKFSFLPTPSRFINDKKILEWKMSFRTEDITKRRSQ